MIAENWGIKYCEIFVNKALNQKIFCAGCTENFERMDTFWQHIEETHWRKYSQIDAHKDFIKISSTCIDLTESDDEEEVGVTIAQKKVVLASTTESENCVKIEKMDKYDEVESSLRLVLGEDIEASQSLSQSSAYTISIPTPEASPVENRMRISFASEAFSPSTSSNANATVQSKGNEQSTPTDSTSQRELPTTESEPTTKTPPPHPQDHLTALDLSRQCSLLNRLGTTLQMELPTTSSNIESSQAYISTTLPDNTEHSLFPVQIMQPTNPIECGNRHSSNQHNYSSLPVQIPLARVSLPKPKGSLAMQGTKRRSIENLPGFDEHHKRSKSGLEKDQIKNYKEHREKKIEQRKQIQNQMPLGQIQRDNIQREFQQQQYQQQQQQYQQQQHQQQHQQQYQQQMQQQMQQQQYQQQMQQNLSSINHCHNSATIPIQQNKPSQQMRQQQPQHQPQQQPQHLQRLHRRLYSCFAPCLPQEQQLASRSRRNSCISPFHCVPCAKYFKTEINFIRHKQTFHDGMNANTKYCEICERRIINSAYEHHEKTQTHLQKLIKKLAPKKPGSIPKRRMTMYDRL